MQIRPVKGQPRTDAIATLEKYGTPHLYDQYEQIESKPLPIVNEENKRGSFIEANTLPVTLNHLKLDTIVPVFSKDNEVTISPPGFIETVHRAASDYFRGEYLDTPEIRASHIIKGRTPDAIHKRVSDLLDFEKTIYYERMAFTVEIPSIYEVVDGNRLNLTVGGVRAYNHENLFSKKSPEKFKVFIGFKNLACTNLCVSTDGLKTEIKVMSLQELYKAVISLFQQYDPIRHVEQMRSLKDSFMTEHQFAQFLGKSRLYQCLPPEKRKKLPELLMTDTQINLVAKSFYYDDNFKVIEEDNLISMWNVYNLLTGANKSSYIDNFLDRSLNATQLATGINKALYGENEYSWFIQ